MLIFLLSIFTTGVALAQGADPLTGYRIVDMSYAYDEDTIYWPTEDDFRLDTAFAGLTEGGYWYEANSMTTAEHGGTHIDAPIHFFADRNTLDQVPIEQLIGPAVVVDVSAGAADNRDYQVSVSDLEAWESEYGRIPDGAIVLLRTGYGRYWPDRVQYMGTDARGPEAVPLLHFPGLHPDAATWLTTERNINAVGLDTPSIDYGQSSLFESHRILNEQNLPAIENVANLDQLPESGAHIIALPMKIAGGSGGPVRMIGLIPD